MLQLCRMGHYIIKCKQPKLCFICQTAIHVGRDCPSWMKQLELVQYLGNATQGLGFFPRGGPVGGE
jgi:hypothetical protein